MIVLRLNKLYVAHCLPLTVKVRNEVSKLHILLS